MRLVPLTREVDGLKVYINPESICRIAPYHDYVKNTTVLSFTDRSNWLEVQEDVETVVKLCLGEE